MVPNSFEKIAVLGGGAWGTALALNAVQAGRQVSLWAFEDDVRETIRTQRENARFLPGIALPAELSLLESAADAAAADAILAVTPAQYLRPVLNELAASLRPGTPVVVCAKGIERGSDKLMTEVLAETLPAAMCAVLSGPSFAEDVARGLPTAVTLAAGAIAIAERLAAALRTANFRPYPGGDPTGAAIGGAVKNVLAIACGVAEARKLGASARAALIARGFAEMRRFAESLGARAETLSGLSGLGDLVLTCSSAQSRNFAFGLALGGGESAGEAAFHARGVVEGAATARPLLERAASLGIDMPITEAVADLVDGKTGVADVIAALMRRPLRAEHE